jgi:hypothetical protein
MLQVVEMTHGEHTHDEASAMSTCLRFCAGQNMPHGVKEPSLPEELMHCIGAVLTVAACQYILNNELVHYSVGQFTMYIFRAGMM